MPGDVFYRGGNSLKPRRQDVRVDPQTGLLKTTHGISVSDQPNGLERFGGAFQVTCLPENLKIIQRGRNSHRYEIVPAYPMTLAEYEKALSQIVLIGV